MSDHPTQIKCSVVQLHLLRLLLPLALCLPVIVQAARVPLPKVAPYPAPELDLHATDGSIHRLADLRGKVVVINFFASWCSPCRYEMPALNRAAALLESSKVVVLGVSIDEDPKALDRFLKGQPVDFPVLYDPSQATGVAWGVRGVPYSFVVDRLGRVVREIRGPREWDKPEIVEPIRALATPQGR